CIRAEPGPTCVCPNVRCWVTTSRTPRSTSPPASIATSGRLSSTSRTHSTNAPSWAVTRNVRRALAAPSRISWPRSRARSGSPGAKSSDRRSSLKCSSRVATRGCFFCLHGSCDVPAWHANIWRAADVAPHTARLSRSRDVPSTPFCGAKQGDGLHKRPDFIRQKRTSKGSLHASYPYPVPRRSRVRHACDRCVRQSVRRAQYPAATGTDVRQDQGHRLPACPRKRHEGADRGDGRDRQ